MSKSNNKTHKLSDLEIQFKRTFGTREGSLVLEHLKKTLRFGENIYHSGESNQDLHYDLGRQSVINDILFILNKEAR